MRSEYTELLAAIEGEIAALLPPEPDAAWFHRVFGDLPSTPGPEIRSTLNAPALDLIRRGGKRWRPLLLMLSAHAFGREDGALSLAPLVEIAHNGSLIVDDIEDGSDTRRGGPAIHLLHGVDAAVNAGNLLYFLPLVLVDGFEAPDSTRLALHARYAAHMRRLHLGQAMDIQWHRSAGFIPGRSGYLTMCALKTGVLARAAAEFGALAAGCRPEAAEEFGSAFEGAGVAFQIIDDVRNLRTGNPGKKRGDDIVEGKKSLPVILACETDASLASKLTTLFEKASAGGAESPAVEEAIGLIQSTGALEAAELLASPLLDAASNRVPELVPPGSWAELLAGLIPMLAGN